MSKQTEKQKKTLAESQAIMKLTPKYRAEGMSLKEAWAKAKKEYFSDRKSKNPLAKTVCYKRGANARGKARKKKNAHIPKKELKFREGKKRGSIMKPGTFKKIEKKAKKAGYKDPKAVAGSAYWKTLAAKYRAAVARRKNPPDPIPAPTKIYDNALESHARKGPDSHYPGQEFFHPWERKGTKIIGLPAGTIISTPDGQIETLNNRTVLYVNEGSDLWDLFKQ